MRSDGLGMVVTLAHAGEGGGGPSATAGGLKEKEWGFPGTIVEAVGVFLWVVPMDLQISKVILTAGIAPIGGDFVVDINIDGVTIFTTQGNRPRVPAGSQFDLSSIPDITLLSEGDVMTVDVDLVGTTFAGSDSNLQIIFA